MLGSLPSLPTSATTGGRAETEPTHCTPGQGTSGACDTGSGGSPGGDTCPVPALAWCGPGWTCPEGQIPTARGAPAWLLGQDKPRGAEPGVPWAGGTWSRSRRRCPRSLPALPGELQHPSPSAEHPRLAAGDAVASFTPPMPNSCLLPACAGQGISHGSHRAGVNDDSSEPLPGHEARCSAEIWRDSVRFTEIQRDLLRFGEISCNLARFPEIR